jgi:stage II sporulation protein D
MIIAVGLVESPSAIQVELRGDFTDESGVAYPAGSYELNSAVILQPSIPASDSFVIRDVTIGIGFHWERSESQGFRGALRVVEAEGLIAINDVSLETYVESVISSEMSPDCPIELLKAHAVISRSWLVSQTRRVDGSGSFTQERSNGPGEFEILRWYGRESHDLFDVCADDHCQRYQGIAAASSPNAARAVEATAGQFLVFEGEVCDARFSKCCGGVTESYRTAWEDRDVEYLVSLYDGEGSPPIFGVDEKWIRSRPPAYCDTSDRQLIETILPGFDQETTDFYRWRVDLNKEDLSALIRDNTGLDLGNIQKLEAEERGMSGRILRLRIMGSDGSLRVGKELEIRRVLSPTHLYSSAFVVRETESAFILVGAGWGHGVGLCQIGAARMASIGFDAIRILRHYYPCAVVALR